MDNVGMVTHEECYGCAACIDVCPQNAISMKEDGCGFRYPHIHRKMCTECGICLKRCPAKTERRKLHGSRQSMLAVYAARSADRSVLKKSSSGGISYEVGKWILEQGGVVAGAAWGKELCVRHVLVEKFEDLHKLQGSKYVQSKCEGIYSKIKGILEDGRKVLFTGTPCQVAALRNIVGEKENLYTVDLICHGVPNQKMFYDYLTGLEKKYRGDIVGFSFRNKEKGWGTIGRADVKQGEKLFTIPIFKTEQSFYYYYLQGVLSRESCYHCAYANDRRVGDITIGDYWGIENIHPEMKNMGQGISLVICNTEKGKNIMEALDNTERKETDFRKACRYNGQLVEPQKYDAVRDEIMRLYLEDGWEAIQHRFDKKIGLRRYADRVKSYVPEVVVRRMKRVRGVLNHEEMKGLCDK